MLISGMCITQHHRINGIFYKYTVNRSDSIDSNRSYLNKHYTKNKYMIRNGWVGYM